jgi:protein-disulfide isomerase
MSALHRLVLWGVAPALVAGSIRAQDSRPAVRPDDALHRRVFAFVSRTTAAPIFGIDIRPPDANGLRKVVARLSADKDGPSRIYYLTPDAAKVLEGDLRDLDPDPWREMRRKIAAIVSGSPARGSPAAPVTLVEFSDFQCPFCAELSREIDRLAEEMPNTVWLIFKRFPISKIHPWADQAARAGICLARQSDKAFWRFERLTFDGQKSVDSEHAAAQLRELALRAGAVPAPFDQCLADGSSAAQVRAAIAAGEAVGVSETPTIFLNGRRISGAISAETLRALITTEANLSKTYP